MEKNGKFYEFMSNSFLDGDQDDMEKKAATEVATEEKVKKEATKKVSLEPMIAIVETKCARTAGSFPKLSFS